LKLPGNGDIGLEIGLRKEKNKRSITGEVVMIILAVEIVDKLI
jgi:hypothetical protein